MATSILLQLPPSLNDPNTKWTLIAFGVAAIIYFFFLRPLKNKKQDPLERPPGASSLSQQRAVERDMSNLLLELTEMTRQMTAQIDTRAAKLELLIKEADEKIAAMKAATARPGGDHVAETHVAAQRPAPYAPPPPAVDPRHAAVYDLADRGRSPHEIAQELGRPSGEIELILALRTDG